MKRLYLFLIALMLSAPTTLYAAGQTILVFGDSLSAGYGIAREATWVSLLQRVLPQDKFVNASVSGETTAGGKRRLPAALTQHRPTIVILELGANDGLRGTNIAEIEANLNEMIEQILANKARVLLVGMQLPPNYGARYTAQFKALYTQLSHRHTIPLHPFLLENLNAQDFQADNLHPNAAAQEKIAHLILQRLRPLL